VISALQRLWWVEREEKGGAQVSGEVDDHSEQSTA
jgi:hypothetical protein